MLKRTLLFFALLLLAVAMVGCSNDEDKDVAATVNGEVITVTDLDIAVDNEVARLTQQGTDMSTQGEEVLATLKADILDGLISQEVLIQAADSYTVTEAEVEEEIALIKAGSGIETEEQYNEALEASGLTHEKLTDSVESDLRLDKYFLDNIAEVEVTDAEVEELFNEYNEMMEGELVFEDIEPMLREEAVNNKQVPEKQKLIDELKEEADIEILI